ncbi:MAG: metallophosphoesterase family protein [Oscillospiraceae bacterium]|jgi:hypothetical protein|nr:metallophosphoesterase family protein [Oscillospiraceae bacterium]
MFRPPLRFHPNGKFKIMQISDVQNCNGMTDRSVDLICAALDKEAPDFVVFTGDQIKGYDPRFYLGSKAAKDRMTRNTIAAIIAPLEERGIPFTFVFGNHDHDCPTCEAEQIRIYQESPLCYTQDTPGVPGYANHAVQILRSDSDAYALNLYMLDSHASKGFSFESLDPAQIQWYRDTRDELARNNGGRFVPSMLFQHICVEEIMELFEEVPRGTRGALEGFRNYRGKFFVLDTFKTAEGSFYGELPSAPDTNAGLFNAAAERGDVMGMYFGHDHNNAFHGKVRGIDLGYSPSAGFTAYGPGRKRGVRVFSFDENEIANYQTWVLTDAQLLPKHAHLPWYTPFADRIPSSWGAAKPLMRRGVMTAVLGIAGGVAVVANRSLRSR